MEFSLLNYLLDQKIDPALAGKIDKACAFHYQPHKGREYTDEGKAVAQIFEKGSADLEELTQVIDIFPGLIIEPATVRKQVHEEGPMSLEGFISNLRLD